MTQAKPKIFNFAEYLSYSGDLEGRYELIDGELVALPPESEPSKREQYADVGIAEYWIIDRPAQ
jgi:Uma2 family endonuclease